MGKLPLAVTLHLSSVRSGILIWFQSHKRGEPQGTMGSRFFGSEFSQFSTFTHHPLGGIFPSGSFRIAMKKWPFVDDLAIKMVMFQPFSIAFSMFYQRLNMNKPTSTHHRRFPPSKDSSPALRFPPCEYASPRSAGRYSSRRLQ